VKRKVARSCRAGLTRSANRANAFPMARWMLHVGPWQETTGQGHETTLSQIAAARGLRSIPAQISVRFYMATPATAPFGSFGTLRFPAPSCLPAARGGRGHCRIIAEKIQRIGAHSFCKTDVANTRLEAGRGAWLTWAASLSREIAYAANVRQEHLPAGPWTRCSTPPQPTSRPTPAAVFASMAPMAVGGSPSSRDNRRPSESSTMRVSEGTAAR